MLNCRINVTLLCISAISFPGLVWAVQPPPDQVRIGTFGIDASGEQSFGNLRPGDPVSVDVGGKSYTGIYIGIQVKGGQKEHVVINATEVQHQAKSGNQPAAGTSSGTSGAPNGADRSTAGAAAGNAAASQVVYRVIFVSPELEKQIAKGQDELSKAQAAARAAIDKYNVAVDESVEKASTTLGSINKILDERALNPPPDLPSNFTKSPIQFTSTDQGLRQSLTVSYHQIVNAHVESPVHVQARASGLAALSDAESSTISGDVAAAKSAAVAAQAYAQFLRAADLLVGLDPVSGFVRDTTELITGTNLINGEQLTDIERAVRVVSAGANLATLGGAAVVTGGIKAVVKFIKRMRGPGPEALNKIFVIVENLPFTKHGMEAFTSRRLELIINSKTEATLTPAWIKRTINEGKSYWDRKHSTIAFISQHETGKWLHVAVSRDGQPVITTIIAKDKFVVDKVLYEGKNRFIPYLEPVPPIEIH